MNRAKAERAWRTARRALDSAYGPGNVAVAMDKEQAAWDRYTDICDELGECTMPGCDAPSPDHVNCPTHREK